MLWNSLQLVSTLMRQRLPYYRASPVFYPQLAGVGLPQSSHQEEDSSWIWFAVPKRKHSKSRKRMKTTVQKRIPLKQNIIFDPRTGEVTLKHKLPFNWKDYLPKVEE
jgi:ribosomal protein L32